MPEKARRLPGGEQCAYLRHSHLQMLEAVAASFYQYQLRIAFEIGDTFPIGNQLVPFLMQYHACGSSGHAIGVIP